MLKKAIGILIILALAAVIVPGALQTAYAVEYYGLWLGGIAVTSLNLSGDGWSFDADSHILTLNGFTFIDATSQPNENLLYGIAYSGKEKLTIVLNGTNTIRSASFYTGSAGIYAMNADVTITGSGRLDVTSGDCMAGQYGQAGGTYGIYIPNHTLTIEGGTIKAVSGSNSSYSSRSTAIEAGTLVIRGGDITAIGGEAPDYASYGLYGADNIEIYGGTVYAEGKRYGAFNLYYAGGRLTAVGPDQAVIQMMRNDQPGTGWTNMEGTEGKTLIPASSWFERVDYTLKKIVFSGEVEKPDQENPVEGDVLPGDVNADGEVDGRDTIRLMKYLAGEIDPETGEPYVINEENSDVTGDKKVDELDLLCIMRYLAGEITSLQ